MTGTGTDELLTVGAVEKHISNIFSKLELPATDEDHRRVLAVLTYLRAAGGFVGPLYGWSSSNGGGGWGAGLLPIAMFGRNDTRSHALVLPVFAHWADSRAGTQTTAVGPLFWRTTPDGGDGGLIPLLFVGRHRHKSYAVVPGPFFHKSDSEGSTDVVGPVYVAHGAHSWAAGVAPLAFLGRDGTRSAPGLGARRVCGYTTQV